MGGGIVRGVEPSMKDNDAGNILVGLGIILGLVIFILTKKAFSFLYGVPFVLMVLGVVRWFGAPSKGAKGLGFCVTLAVTIGLFSALVAVAKHFLGVDIWGR